MKNLNYFGFLFLVVISRPVMAEIPEHEEKIPPTKLEIPQRHEEEEEKRKPGVKPSGVCNDLARFSAAPGEYDDGTGIAYSPGKVNETLQALKAKEFATYQAAYLKALKAPPFRKRILDLTGIASHPGCEKPDTASVQCLKNASAELAKISLGRAFLSTGSGRNREPGGDITDFDLLIHDDTFLKTEKQLIESSRSKITNKAMSKKIEEDIFPKVRKILVGVLEKNIQDPELKKNIMEKVNSIRYAGSDCSDFFADPKGNSVAGLAIPNAFYQRITNSFKFCNGFLLQNQSAFQIAFTIAHELAHSIDPCGIVVDAENKRFDYVKPKDREFCEQAYPFKGLIPCLRGSDSIQAKTLEPASDLGPLGRIPGLPPPEKQNDKPKPDDSILPPVRKQGPQLSDRSPFCTKDDQISEAFADRIAIEVTPAFIKQEYKDRKPPLTKENYQIGYSNVFRDVIGYKDAVDEKFDEHPDTKDRINKIILTHPEVREQMGCLPETVDGTVSCPLSKEKKT